MKKTLLGLLSAISVAAYAVSPSLYREQEIPTVPDYEPAARFSPRRLHKTIFSTQITPMWFSDSNKFIYRYKTSRGEKIYMVDAGNARKEEVINMNELAMQLTATMKDPFDAQHIKFENLDIKHDKYITFSITGSQERVFDNDSSAIATRKRGTKQSYYFQYDLETKSLENVTEEEQDKDIIYPHYAVISPDGTKGVYAKGYNLYMMDETNLRKAALSETDSTIVEIALTDNGTHNFCWGADNYKGNTAKDAKERVRPSSLVWSPNSKNFATIRWDMARIKDAWVINSLDTPRPTLETFKFRCPENLEPTVISISLTLKTGRTGKSRHLPTKKVTWNLNTICRKTRTWTKTIWPMYCNGKVMNTDST